MSDNRLFCFPVRIFYEDTDAGGVVYHASYLRFLDRARTEWLRTLGFTQSYLMENNIAFVVRHIDLHYRRAAQLDDQLEVISEIRQLKRASLIFYQKIVSSSAQLLLDGEVHIACIDMNQQRPVAIPQSVMEVLASVS